VAILDPLKADMLRDLGFGGDPGLYEPLLEEAGLSRPRRSRISQAKRDRVRDLLESRYFRICSRGDCATLAAGRRGGRVSAPASSPEHCEVCGGSVNRRAVDEMVQACRRAGWAELCIVGGSPNLRQELESLIAGRLRLTLIDGTRRRSLAQAQADIARADRVVVWGGTMLDHKVSNLYTGPKVTTSHRRSIGELAAEVVRSAAGR
jgi:hypothetical protein